ncbi:MAG: phosphate signaling complex protein PhoU [Candidatus Eiseniibacteriota bacterium]
MSKHLQRDLDYLKRDILEMGRLAEEAMAAAVDAVFDRRVATAERVIQGDEILDTKEVEVEAECLKILALHQPVAADLRFLVAVLKVNNDLERVGDLAKNIAERALDLARAGWTQAPSKELRRMMQRVQSMLTRSLDALVRLDPQLARSVCRDDDEVDLLLKEIFDAVSKAIIQDPQNVRLFIATLSVARYLERIADQTTNIAEDVVFLVEGEVIRHGGGGQDNIVPLPRDRSA